MPPVAASKARNRVPTVAFGKVVVEICNGAGPTITVVDIVAVCGVGDEESVTATVTLDWPAVCGVPLTWPLAARVSPAGICPDASDHV